LARKNEIFAASGNDKKSTAVIPEGIHRQDAMKEFGWEVPVDVAPLPSAGVIYPTSSSLHGKKMLEIKAMTARECQKLTAGSGLLSQSLLDLA